MWRFETRPKLDDAACTAVAVLLEAAEAHDGFPPLSDHLLLDLDRGGPGFAAVLAYHEAGSVAGYAQLSKANASTVIELVVAPDERARCGGDLVPSLLRAAIEEASSNDDGAVHWWVHHPDDHVAAVAAEVGLQLDRRLLQMRRSLPIEQTTSIETRAFVVGRDEAEWVRVNNAAFRDHPEQGGWTIETLQLRESESWFDPDGFRLHERDGRLAAFCWTKVHDNATPPMGEIYVIAVDPPFHGLGLGKALTIAGLDHLAGEGLTIGMLHVDGANISALSLYEQLGFSIHHEDHAYTRSSHP